MAERKKLIRASEIGEYVFCARAWRLRVEGVEATGWAGARERGTAWHRGHGRGVRSARNLRRLATAAFALASLLALVIVAQLWWRG
jgi:hypothetical protein